MNELLKTYLTTEGRMNRLPFLKYNVILILIFSMISFVLHLAFGIEGFMSNAVDVVVSILGFGCYLSLMIRRLHDLDKGGIWALLNFIPAVNIIFGIYLLCAKGTDGYNRFGEDPLQSY